MPTKKPRKSGPLSNMTRVNELIGAKKFPRNADSVQVNSRIWPDVMELLRQHAEEYQLSHGGAIHHVLRKHFGLPEIPLNNDTNTNTNP